MAFSTVVLLIILAFGALSGVHAAFDSLVGGINLDIAPDVLRYTVPDVEGLEDPHPVHGIEMLNGDFALVGKALRCETCRDVEGFLVIVDGDTGSTSWQYSHGIDGKDAINAVAQLPDGDLLLVGFQTLDGIAKRSLVRVRPSERRVLWTSTDFGDTRGSHGAWEMVDVTGDSVLLAGVSGRRSTDEMWFKSYGNVPEGDAVVMEIPFSALNSPPAASSASWEKNWDGSDYTFITAKAARSAPGGGVLVLLWGEEASASLQLFDSQRQPVWGPTKYGEVHGEATDVSISSDGTSAGISGHGCIQCDDELLGKMTSVRLSDGVLEWSEGFSVCDPTAHPSCTAIFNECWGLQAVPSGGFVMACGAGIENCDLLTGDNLSQCERDKPVAVDPRPGAKPRPPAVWMSFVVRVDANGRLLWQRVDQVGGNL